MSSKEEIRSMLSGGNRRSIGQVADVIDLVRENSKLARMLVQFLEDKDECVRMRAADALEKFSRDRAVLFQSYEAALLCSLATATQQEVRWHLAVIIPRLQLTSSERRRAANILEIYLEDRSSIVKTYAMQGLADLAQQQSSLFPGVMNMLQHLAETGTPDMRARGHKLLAELRKRN